MRGTVLEVRRTGLRIRFDQLGSKKEAWLPAAEWSATESEWNSASALLEPGSECDFIFLSRYEDGHPVVSRKRFKLADIDNSWIHEPREMKITDIGRTLIRGTIGDSFPAIVRRESYLEWIEDKKLPQQWLDHSVLGRGDLIRGNVKSISTEASCVELDVRGWLVSRDKEIEEAVRNAGTTSLDESAKYSPEAGDLLEPEIVAAISPVLLADDHDKCRSAIAAMLRRAQIEVHTIGNLQEAKSYLEQLSLGGTPNVPFKLAILDPNLETDNTDFIGLKIAEELSRVPGCRSIIMTGMEASQNLLRLFSQLKIYGYVEKPFTTERLVDEIKSASSVDQPDTLEKWINTQSDFLPAPSSVLTSSFTDGFGEKSLAEVLHALGRLKPGSVIHVFQLHPRSFRARSLEKFGDGLQWERLSGKIAKSVIKDAVYSELPIIESAAGNKANHLWTRQMMDYQSFCGIPVQAKGLRLSLVAFHRDLNAFNEDFVVAARLAAEQAGRVVERQRLEVNRGHETGLVSQGMALASLAHELVSDLTALDANLAEVFDLIGHRSDQPNSRSETLRTLEQMRRDITDISEKTRILRGIHARSGLISVVDCLKKANVACKKFVGDTFEHPERIVIHPVESVAGSWEIAAPAASLIIVFFNLYLNAAQQIELASPIRTSGVVWHSLSRFIDPKGRSWARLSIHDSGPGIHHDDWERVFDPGFSTKVNGSGMGLYICRHLLREISGRIFVASSRIWDGTTFSVELPLVLSHKTSSIK